LGAIFVSYRRSDSQGEAGRLFDDLVKHFGDNMVFMDVAGIEAGRDFRKVIEENVARCGVLLVVIGPEWLNAKDESGARRLDDSSDFVRLETASALSRDIPVIPVLVRNAEMPHSEQLPEGLKDLAYRNCCELTHARWKSDIQLLIEPLRRLIGDSGESGKKTGPKQPTASSQRGIPKQEVSGSTELENATSARIDPATVQRISRELTLHIGPIADIVVRRVASRCSSAEDLYLKVAEEIGSPLGREKFLSNRSPARLDVQKSASGPANTPAASASPPLPQRNDAEIKTVPATGKPRVNQSKYLLLGGAVILLFLALVLAAHFAPSRRTGSTHAAQTSHQKTPIAESVPVKSDTSPSVMGNGGVNGVPVGVPKDSIGGGDGDKIGSTKAEALKAATPQRVRVSQGVLSSLLIRKVLPVYPSTARQARVQGAVVLQAEISKDGAVESLREIRGHPLLIPAAIDAVKQWQYKPYVMNGEPVAVQTTITVDFTLKNE
jgi:TonB family protein